MSESSIAIAGRFRGVAATFGARVAEVPPERWDDPAPCEGWVARDVVRHVVEWVPGYFSGRWELPFEPGPSVDDDPAAAWEHVRTWLQQHLDDPVVADEHREVPPFPMTFADAFAMIGLTDVLIHTWDLARATGLDERLDATEVRRWVEGMEAMDEAIRGEHFGPRVAVPDDADDQTRLLAFLGRRPV